MRYMVSHETRLVTPTQPGLSTPVDRSSASAYRDGQRRQYYYQRHGNPTGDVAEELLGLLDGGRALVFPSGMSAVTAAIMGLLRSGSRVAISDDAYYGVSRLEDVLGDWGLRFVVFDPLTEPVPTNVDLVWIEAPSSSRLRFPNMRSVVNAAHENGALVAVDATVATPLYFRPIEYGVDVTVHSATKWLAGHSDVLLGVVTCREEWAAARIEKFRKYTGCIASPDAVWLLLRGLKTLAVRLERQSATARALADRLAAHPAVAKVYYPTLNADSGRDELLGSGALVSFEVHGSTETAELVERSTNIFVNSTSFGGCESLIEARYRWEAGRMPLSLVRISVGLEDVDDLWHDLEHALNVASLVHSGEAVP
jgi:cystathionine gamma-synthase